MRQQFIWVTHTQSREWRHRMPCRATQGSTQKQSEPVGLWQAGFVMMRGLGDPWFSNSHLLSHLMWTLCYSSFGPKNLGVPFHHLFPSHLLPVIRQSCSVDFNISLESVPFLLWLQLLSWQIWKSFLAWTIALGNKHCNRISCFSFHLSRAILNKDVKLS